MSNLHIIGQYTQPQNFVYGFKPTAPIDLLPLPLQEHVNFDASKRAEFVKKLHDEASANIEKMTKLYEKRANKGRKKMMFEEGDLVWGHLRKDRFLAQCKSKLQSRADGPFKVLERINDNACKIDLPSEYGVSTTFNVSDLSPYYGTEESRTTPFQGGRMMRTSQLLHQYKDQLHEVVQRNYNKR
jgi:hypothetical protein